MFCVGKKEEAAGTIDVRDRDEGKSIGLYSVESALSFLKTKLPPMSEEEI